MGVRLICLGVGYCLGLFQTSYILGKLHGIDIRNYGSGNAGTTNMMRTMGTKSRPAYLCRRLFKVCAGYCAGMSLPWKEP